MKMRALAKILIMASVGLELGVLPPAGKARAQTAQEAATRPDERLMQSQLRPAGKQRLTIEDCVHLGLKNSKSIHTSGLRVEAASAEHKEAEAAKLPSLKFAAGYTRLSEIPPFEVHLPFPQNLPFVLPSSFVVSPNYYNNYLLKLGVQQPLFTGFRLRSASEAARLQAGAAEQELARDQMDLIFSIRVAYWTLYKSREIQRVVNENVEQVKAHLADVRNFFEQGLLTKNEVLRVEVQLANARMIQLDAANRAESAGLRLDNLIGIPLDTEIELATAAGEGAADVSGEPKPLDSDPGAAPRAAAGTAEELVTRALSQRPELKSLGLRAKAGEAGVKLAKSALYPQVYLNLNYYNMRPNPRVMPARDNFYSTWDAGVAVSMDLWNWGQAGWRAKREKAKLEQIEDALGQMEDAVELEVRQSRLDLSLAEEKIAFAGQAVAQAEENLRVTTDRFKEGVALNADVLDAEVAWLQAKTNRTQSLVDCEIAKAKLQKALGE